MQRTLEAAQGYMSLGLPDDALEELDRLRGEDAAAPMVAGLKIEIHQERKEWGKARELAEAMAKAEPSDPHWWIAWAYALRREKTVHEARGVLWEAVQRHPGVGLIHYNLACYACVLGELAKARELLGKARALEPGVREMALKDDDLLALREELLAEGG